MMARNNREAEMLLDAILDAADIALDEVEYDVALETIAAVAVGPDDGAEAPAARLVSEIEKNIGLGLDEKQFAQAVSAAVALLVPTPIIAPDAHLELAYEDRCTIGDP